MRRSGGARATPARVRRCRAPAGWRRLARGDRGEVGPRVESPRPGAHVAPLTRACLPRCRRTSALTIRGEPPRRNHLDALEAARCTSPPASRPPALSVSLIGPQRCFGDTPSYGSATELQPRLRRACRACVSSTFSVRPPEVEKKYVTTGLALVGDDLAARLGDRLASVDGRLRRHAAVDLRARVGVLVEPRAGLAVVTAYVRAATACALSASSGHDDGDSRTTTPRDVVLERDPR